MKKKITKLDKEFMDLHLAYMKLYEKFEADFGNRVVKPGKDAEAFAELYAQIAKTYNELAYIITFVVDRYKICTEISMHASAFDKRVRNAQ